MNGLRALPDIPKDLCDMKPDWDRNLETSPKSG